MTLWHTIQSREAFESFPCVPEGVDVGRNAVSYFCSSEDTPECKIAELCPLRPIYEEYVALRAVVMAILGDDMPMEMARICQYELAMESIPEVQEGLRQKIVAWEGIA